jgi:hypothetical protein
MIPASRTVLLWSGASDEFTKASRRSLLPNLSRSGRCGSDRLIVLALKDVIKEDERRKQDNRAEEQR